MRREAIGEDAPAEAPTAAFQSSGSTSHAHGRAERFVVSTIRYALIFPVILLLNSQFLVGQTTEKKLDDAIAEISLLKRVIAEQDRRISDLEKTVGALERAAKPDLSAPGNQVDAPLIKLGHGVENDRSVEPLEGGMSRAQVEAILGRPTSAEPLSNYLTLFYSGQVAGSGSVAGTVKLEDDRVWQVNKPVF